MPKASRVDLPQQHAMQDLYLQAARGALSADEQACLASEVVAGIRLAGFASHFVPRRYGGQQAGFRRLWPLLARLGQACPSAAWCATIYAVAARMAAYLPEQAQQRLWHNGPDTLISSAFRPSGQAVMTSEGWCLSGRWSYLSGIDYADWALLCFSPPEAPAEPRFAAIPRLQWLVEDDWYSLGMRGTGSRSITLEAVRVSREMSFAGRDLFHECSQAHPESLYQASPVGSDPPLFMACALGASRCALKLWSDLQRIDGFTERAAMLYAGVQTRLDSSRLVLAQACRRTDRGLNLPLDMAKNARDASFVAELLLASIHQLFRHDGTRAQSESSQLQRLWRDIQTLTTHTSLRQPRNDLNYARCALDREAWQASACPIVAPIVVPSVAASLGDGDIQHG